MASSIITSANYYVEISGWDEDEDFFVEQAELEWIQEEDKRAFLRHCPREGSILFIRLAQASEVAPTCPVAYTVQRVVRNGHGERWEVHLVQKRPESHSRLTPASRQ